MNILEMSFSGGVFIAAVIIIRAAAIDHLPPGQTEEYRGGWSLYDGEIMESFPAVGNGGANEAVYSLLCLKQAVFEDGTVWKNPDYEYWLKNYAGKETDVDELQNYYPHEYRIEFGGNR